LLIGAAPRCAGVFQAWICMVGYFSIFLWYNIPINKVVMGVDNDHFDYTIDNPKSLTFDCVKVNGVTRCKHNIPPHRQVDIWRMAQTCWYVTLVMCQFWHIWVCKTRQVSIFTHGLFKNFVTIIGTAFSILIVIIITYIPQLHSIFDTNSLIGIGWLPNLMFLIFILPYTEFSKYLVRKDPDCWWAQYMQW
jgi:magnesium-transporting ATPase (P-type)